MALIIGGMAVIPGDGCCGGGSIPEAPMDGKLYGRRLAEWSELTQAYYRGAFDTKQALVTAHPSDITGAFSVVLDTGTFWIWNNGSWVDTGKDASGVGVEEAPANGKQYARKDSSWSEVIAGGGGVSSHDDLTDVRGRGDRHVSEQDLEFIGDYVERRPIRPINLSPVNGELEVGEQPLFESTPYIHPFNLEMYGYQLQILNASDEVVYDSGNIEMLATQYRLQSGILKENMEYRWRVRYQSVNLQWSEWSAATAFRTQIDFASASVLRPNIIMPQQGGVQSSQVATIVTAPFESVGGLIQADGEYQIATSPDFSTVVDSGLGRDSWVGTVPLERGHPYFARVNHKTTSGEVSPWSSARTFVIKQYYRGQRIGLVLRDPEKWIFERIGENYEPVTLDSEYWKANSIYAGLEASWNKGISTQIDGQHMLALPSFWIHSGVVPSGPYKGKRFWLIDPTEPTQQEQNEGWHRHGAFKSPNMGWLDKIYISAYRVSTTGESKPDGALSSSQYNGSAIVNIINTYRNTDSVNPLKSGWHLMNYMEFEALKLLCLIEEGSLENFYNNTILFKEGMYRNMPLLRPDKMWIDGIVHGKAALPGSNEYVSFTPRMTWDDVKVIDISGTAFGDPAELYFDDYLIGTSKVGAGRDDYYAKNGKSYSRWENGSSEWKIFWTGVNGKNTGVLGFSQSWPAGQGMMAKY